ncbi:DUF3108 domain-containing protein [Candidatus Kapabacteria bacterium]|nr:DUF3108 domain-containing protein [Candidatus Kapabacteria bacterium]
MKNIYLILIILSSLTFSQGFNPFQKSSSTFRSIENNAFDYGEQLFYDVGYGFITAGEGHFKVMAKPKILNGRNTYDIRFAVKSLSSLRWLYRVHDRYQTFVDEQGIFPWQYEQHIKEGGYRRDVKTFFNQEKNFAVTGKDTTQIPEYVHDVVSALYYLRTMDLSEVKNDSIIEFNQFFNDSTYVLGIKIIKREIIEVDAGEFHTILIEPLVVEGGLFKSEGSIKVWITDDEKKIPVKVGTKVLIGFVGAELRDYKGIKGKINAKID